MKRLLIVSLLLLTFSVATQAGPTFRGLKLADGVVTATTEYVTATYVVGGDGAFLIDEYGCVYWWDENRGGYFLEEDDPGFEYGLFFFADMSYEEWAYVNDEDPPFSVQLDSGYWQYV